MACADSPASIKNKVYRRRPTAQVVKQESSALGIDA